VISGPTAGVAEHEAGPAVRGVDETLMRLDISGWLTAVVGSVDAHPVQKANL
jgi:hypothetical protein